MKKFLKYIILFLILSLPISVSAFDEKGVSASIGYKSKNDSTVIGWQANCHDFYWNSIGLFGRNNYDLWYIDYELDLGYLKWSAANSEEKNGDTFSKEFRTIFMRNFNKFHIGIGGGCALLSDTNDIMHLTKDGFYGLITGRIRLPFKNKYGIDIEGDHISSVFGEDAGINVWKLRFYCLF